MTDSIETVTVEAEEAGGRIDRVLAVGAHLRIFGLERGELLLEHVHGGVDLRADYARETLSALVRVWKRPVALATKVDDKAVLLRHDGKEHSTAPSKA